MAHGQIIQSNKTN